MEVEVSEIMKQVLRNYGSQWRWKCMCALHAKKMHHLCWPI